MIFRSHLRFACESRIPELRALEVENPLRNTFISFKTVSLQIMPLPRLTAEFPSQGHDLTD
jgi:hypothetical protein